MAKLNLSTGNFLNVEKRNPVQESTRSKCLTDDGIYFLHFLLQGAADCFGGETEIKIVTLIFLMLLCCRRRNSLGLDTALVRHRGRDGDRAGLCCRGPANTWSFSARC